MRLEAVEIQNFRTWVHERVELAEHLTLLVGENDSGKSNLIDAIRLTTPSTAARPTLSFDVDRDLSFARVRGDDVIITRRFADLTAAQDALFTPALIDAHRNLVQTTTYKTDEGLFARQRVSHSVGDGMLPDPEPENRDRISHVYLPPLRDAARALDSADGGRLAEVFKAIASPAEIEAFEAQANKSLEELASDEVARKVVTSVQGHLTSVTRPVRHRIVDVRSRAQRLRWIARSLRLHMAAHGMSPADLLASGLGYLNLLYIATVVLELEKAREFDLTLLLVEEPEAHLHPQLQSVLLTYLLEQATESARHVIDGLQPAGRVQVVATTHSPQLASSVSTSNVVVLRTETIPPAGGVDGGGEKPVQPQSQTAAVSLAARGLSPRQRRKVDRYLDTTKAALLFARQAILVEGIAEALLLRVLAETVVYRAQPGEEEFNKICREQFRAISVVAVDGVDFLPFISILLGKKPICDRVVVVTDRDGGPGDARKNAIETSYADDVAEGRLAVFVGPTTLEAELFRAPANEEILRNAFLEQHPQSAAKWDAICGDSEMDPATRANAFSDALRRKALDLSKGDFAHVIAEALQADDGGLEVPEYLVQAIRAAIIPPIAQVEAEGQ